MLERGVDGGLEGVLEGVLEEIRLQCLCDFLAFFQVTLWCEGGRRWVIRCVGGLALFSASKVS